MDEEDTKSVLSAISHDMPRSICFARCVDLI